PVTHLRKIMLEEPSRFIPNGREGRATATRLSQSEPGKTRIRLAPLGTMRWVVQVRRSGGDPVLVLQSNTIPITVRLVREDQDGNDAPAIRSVYCSCHYISFFSF